MMLAEIIAMWVVVALMAYGFVLNQLKCLQKQYSVSNPQGWAGGRRLLGRRGKVVAMPYRRRAPQTVVALAAVFRAPRPCVGGGTVAEYTYI